MSVAKPSQSAAEQQVWQESGFDILRRKWRTVPGDISVRLESEKLLKLPTTELVQTWTRLRNADVEGDGFQVRGWYHELYREFLAEKKVLDIGCGFGISSITFAEFGAAVTFVDIVEENVRVVQRVCEGLGLAERVNFQFIKGMGDFRKLAHDFDVITAMGSLHNAPFDFMREEVAELVKHLRVGGRWLQLAYPKARWIREGRMPFSDWGRVTDGEGTPYCEWYDLNKVLRLLAPAKFEPILCYEWHNQDFNWFDLKLIQYEGAEPPGPSEVVAAELIEELQKAEGHANAQAKELELQRNRLVLFENSRGGRALQRWCQLRDRIAPHGTTRRKLYDRVLSYFA